MAKGPRNERGFVRALFHRHRSPFSCSLRWPDVGFVCPVSVSCVFCKGSVKRNSVSRLFFFLLCIRGTWGPNISIPIFSFCLFFQSCVWWTRSTSSFVNQQICLCIFQCFWDKNMLHIVSSILACVRTVIWYNTLYSCFVFLGISIVQKKAIPPFSDGCLALATYPQSCSSQKCQENVGIVVPWCENEKSRYRLDLRRGHIIKIWVSCGSSPALLTSG